jgi:ABC-2 type transport system ATP-binding protein
MIDPSITDIEVDKLSRNFGDVHAVKQVSFSVPRGEIFGFLGPNGAGKSTTIRMLCTLLRPTGGNARVAGFNIVDDPAQVRARIGLVAEKLILYDRLTAFENLVFFGRMNHLPKAEILSRGEEWLKRLGMYEWRNKLAGTFSTGMKQRVNIARALLTQPSIMFLDEPTLGLDPQTTRTIRQFIKELAESNITVVLTTHIMAEAEALCDRISIIDHGSIVALDTAANLENLLNEEGMVLDLIVEDLDDRVKSALGGLDFVQGVGEPEAGRLRVTASASDGIRKIIDTVEENGGSVKGVNTKEPNLEDVFLHLTGTQMRVEISSSAGTAAGGPGARRKRSRIR